MSLSFSTCVFFIPLMQSVNGAQFLNITFIFLVFGAATILVFETAIVYLTNMYASL